MKKLFITFLSSLLLIVLATLSACGGGYIAIGFVNVNKPNYHAVSFYSLRGTRSFTLTNQLSDDNCVLYYSTSLEKGEFNLYLEVDGQKILIANEKEGVYSPEVEKYFDGVDFNKHRKVKITIETVNEAINGKVIVRFEPKNAQRISIN
ncbi:MAG: hypothetical protein IJA15_06395 [Clostridia bacterium]|nr:hypothetical protein [Clostridia bacterium]